MRRFLRAARVAAVTLGVSGCGGYTSSSPMAPSAPSTAPPANTVTIDVAEINGPRSFYPSPATVTSGQIVIWRNTDRFTHHVVFDDMSVDTGTLAPNTVSQPITVGVGTWQYHCSIHPSMVGTVTVTPPAGGNGSGSY